MTAKRVHASSEMISNLFRAPDPRSDSGHIAFVVPDGRRADILERLTSATAIVDAGYETQCWQWTAADLGAGRGGGYGRMKLNGRTVAVHIVSFTNFYGYVPGNKQIDHRCMNRLCWRPDHLEMVSHRENQRRRAAARRARR